MVSRSRMSRLGYRKLASEFGRRSEYKKPLPKCCIIHSNWLKAFILLLLLFLFFKTKVNTVCLYVWVFFSYFYFYLLFPLSPPGVFLWAMSMFHLQGKRPSALPFICLGNSPWKQFRKNEYFSRCWIIIIVLQWCCTGMYKDLVAYRAFANWKNGTGSIN